MLPLQCTQFSLNLPSIFLFIENPSLPFILKTKHASGYPEEKWKLILIFKHYN